MSVPEDKKIGLVECAQCGEVYVTQWRPGGEIKCVFCGGMVIRDVNPSDVISVEAVSVH